MKAFSLAKEIGIVWRALHAHEKRHGCSDWWKEVVPADGVRLTDRDCAVRWALVETWITLKRAEEVGALLDAIREVATAPCSHLFQGGCPFCREEVGLPAKAEEAFGPAAPPARPRPPLTLSGEDGNAFVIIGRARRAARRAGWSNEQIEAWTAEATAGDYDHVLQTAMRDFEVT